MNKEVSWCNGSTTDFGSVCPSSNLGSPTEKAPVGENRQELFRYFPCKALGGSRFFSKYGKTFRILVKVR